MNLLPIISSTQMQQIEARAFEAGQSQQLYMETAGAAIASELEAFLVTPNEVGTIYLLVGKGNNGGDALCAGSLLVQKGYSVTSFCLYPQSECSPLSQKMAKAFQEAGGQLTEIFQPPQFEKGIIVDGLAGTGWKGKAEGLLANVIEAANQSELPIFSVDIPSGLNGNTGKVESVAIEATHTLFLGFPKTGFFIEQGWDHVGNLTPIDFGMPPSFTQELVAESFLMEEEEASKLLPKLKRSRHKYSAGYTLAVAGSPSMPGAALLSCLATLTVGAGIVQLFHPPHMQEALASAPYELIRKEFDISTLCEEAKRADSLLIGPGMGRDASALQTLKQVLSKLNLPTVIDADALFLLAQNPGIALPEKTLLTPHKKEMERLLKAPPNFENCQDFAKKHRVTIVLKGAPTTIFSPHTTPVIIPQGDPGMATAGSGDVLTGILGGLLAQGLPPFQASLLGTVIHGIAGEEGADTYTSYGLTASKLLKFIPDAIQILQPRREG